MLVGRDAGVDFALSPLSKWPLGVLTLERIFGEVITATSVADTAPCTIPARLAAKMPTILTRVLQRLRSPDLYWVSYRTTEPGHVNVRFVRLDIYLERRCIYIYSCLYVYLCSFIIWSSRLCDSAFAS